MLFPANRYITSSRLHQKQMQKQHASLPCLADKALTLRMQQLQGAALSPATKQAYATGIKCYMSFCRKYSITPFPTTQLTLCYFVAYLSRQVQHATIRLYIAAVRAEQMSQGLEDPLKDTQQLSWLLRGVQRRSKTRTRLPINPKLLQQLIESILSNRHLSKYTFMQQPSALHTSDV